MEQDEPAGKLANRESDERRGPVAGPWRRCLTDFVMETEVNAQGMSARFSFQRRALVSKSVAGFQRRQQKVHATPATINGAPRQRTRFIEDRGPYARMGADNAAYRAEP